MFFDLPLHVSLYLALKETEFDCEEYRRSRVSGETLNSHTMVESLAEVRIPVSLQQDIQEAITVIQSGYGAKLRHAGRVHTVNLASIHEQLEQGAFELECCDTKRQDSRM